MLKRVLLIIAALLLVFISSSCSKSKGDDPVTRDSDANASVLGEATDGITPSNVPAVPIATINTSDDITQTPDSADTGVIFFDDFIDGYDESAWSAMLQHENPNNELQFYYPENVFAQDGTLKLRAIIEEFCGFDYTSGLISTQGKLAFKYVDIEIRARYPQGKGLFAAIWLSPVEEEDSLPEIDIMQVVGDMPGNVWAVYYYRDSGDKKRTTGNYLGISNPEDFHIYRLEWSEDSISWYIDGDLVNKTNRSPDMSMYLNMGLAVGGDWPGDPSEFTVFPADFEIDYVKISQDDNNQ